MYRDLKCENFLLDKDNNLMIFDFGFVCDNLILVMGKWKFCYMYCGLYVYVLFEILKGVIFFVIFR